MLGMNTSQYKERDEGEKSMEQKQIVAVVLIVIIIGAIALVGFMFLPAGPYGAVKIGQLVTPGAPAGTPSDNIIVVGILDPMTEIQGEGAWYGSYLACDEINTAGGVTVGGETYYFGLISEDTSEADPELDTSKGVAAATKIITEDNAQFLLGGFRTEALLAYIETVMDEDMIFIDTGASTDDFCQNVIDDYDRYKYFFRAMPINSTSLASSLLRYILYLDGYLEAVTGENVTKVAIIREGLDWTAGMSLFLNGYLPGYGFEIVEEVAYPITAEATDFATYWSQIEAAGAQITVPIISAQGGILMMTQYAQAQPGCVLAGIDVMSQLDSYWDETGGGCAYEVVLQSTLRTNKTTRTIAFWDAFLAAYESEPLYTAVGSYDAMYILAQAIDEAQSFDADDVVAAMEEFTLADPFIGAGGRIAWTLGHDLFEGPDYSYTLFCQWQDDGTKQVVSSGGLIYPDSIVTAPFQLPQWAGWSLNP
jgi:branched-chain amino acid transport system substrate-binding protein